MSTSVGLSKSTPVWEPPAVKPLDEAVWRAWGAKGRAHDRRDSATRIKAVKWISIAVLLVAAGLWSRVTPYEVVVRFIVAAGALVVMFQAFHARHFAVGAVFAALSLLNNPVAPVFSFSGDWPRVLVVASAFPFVASLAWRRVRLPRND